MPKYTTITGVRNTPTPAPFDMPIIGHQALYNRLDVPSGAAVLIAEGNSEGYPDITSLFMPVCDVFGFNPYKIKPFLINEGGKTYSDGFIPAIIDAFMGEMEEDNQNGGFFYPTLNDTDYGAVFYGDGYSSDQAGIGGTIYSGGVNLPFRDVMYNIDKFQANDGVQFRFEIWPETVIERGYIDTQHFQRDEGLIRSGQILLNIWKANNRYYFEIYLRSFNYLLPWTQAVDLLNGAETNHVYNPDNPYDNKQDEGNEGGDGPYDNDSDPVEVPDIPSIDITALGGLNLYKLTAADMAALFSYLGSNDPGNAIVKWFTNPIQAISACYMLPYPVHVNGSKEITVLGAHTGVTAYSAGPWTEWNLGAVKINQGFGDCFLDYSNFTRVSIFLPFIGVRQLNADDVIGNTIGIKYQFDNISGACSAYITVNDSVRYTFSGSCAVGIPISQSNWGQTYMAAATAAAGALAGGFGAAAGAIGEGAGVGEAVAAGALGAVKGGGGLSAFSAKPTISRSGAVCGAGAAIGLNKPVMFIERPDKAKIEDPKNVIGITSGRTLSLGSLSGYNAIEHVHLHGISATGPELDEIEKLLYQGVIF